jgi:hypothetical protein
VNLLVRDIILDARNEHPAFTRERHSNRSCVGYLSERHRVYYKELADDLKDRLSVELLLESNALAAVGPDGIPYAVADGSDGHAIAVGRADGVAYLASPLVAQGDYTLPADSLQIIAIWATLTTAHQRVPVRWLPIAKKAQFGTGDGLVATVSGFQLTPLVNPTGIGTLWDAVESITVAYIPEPPEFDDERLETLDQEILIPTVYGHCLKWQLAAFMARHEAAMNKEFPARLLQFYLSEATAAGERARSGAVLDHRIIKQHRTTRNR